jgi:ABC-type nickel/cobalt efflux system permease component RcnA
MLDTSLTAALGVGFLLGIRHATDADHIATVSTFVSEHRSVARSCLLGTFWGAGHTLALLVAGLATIAFKLTIPPPVERGLEMGVAFVLILLGSHGLLRSLAPVRVHRHDHVHDGRRHHHVHVHASAADGHGHPHLLRLGGRPFLVGVLHGLAGSAALMLLVLATIPNPLGGVVYILVFGVGSTAGMLVLSGLVAVPFALAANRSHAVHATVRALAGASSLLLGLWLGWHLGGA